MGKLFGFVFCIAGVSGVPDCESLLVKFGFGDNRATPILLSEQGETPGQVGGFEVMRQPHLHNEHGGFTFQPAKSRLELIVISTGSYGHQFPT